MFWVQYIHIPRSRRDTPRKRERAKRSRGTSRGIKRWSVRRVEKDSLLPISVFHFFPRQGYHAREPASLSPRAYTHPLFSAAFLLLFLALLFLYLSIFLPFHSSRCKRARFLPPLPLSPASSLPRNVAFNRASTLLAVVRNPRRFAATRAATRAEGVHRGNDAQIGRIISKTTNPPAS